jgi:pimeloyl-ACP methyl ester carboxylesterase
LDRTAAVQDRQLDDPPRFDLESPIWRHLYRELAKDHTLARYDARGNGLSDRVVDEISFDALVSDLETVVDATGIERFALLGISRGVQFRSPMRFDIRSGCRISSSTAASLWAGRGAPALPRNAKKMPPS